MLWEEMQKQIRETFGFPVSIDSPYKLCDYKMAYRERFDVYLKNMISGDIAAYIEIPHCKLLVSYIAMHGVSEVARCIHIK